MKINFISDLIRTTFLDHFHYNIPGMHIYSDQCSQSSPSLFGQFSSN